ncbi:hypothetical protein VKT23_002681 [Stygiomarasmius scandens]|uniref:Uncharacterized protein n=1 Tax=Marasmiellus scandens TaxID=2682957 RepID=A0ABR1K880_9AGAR
MASNKDVSGDDSVDVESNEAYVQRSNLHYWMASASDVFSFLHTRRLLRTIIVVQWLLIALLTVFSIFRHRLFEVSSTSKSLFSPTEDVVRYQVQELSFAHHTPYKGASPEVDRLWSELFNVSKTVVSKDEVSSLANKPDPLYLGGESTHGHHHRAASAEPVYVVELDVFSQLRCLDDIRKFIHSEIYTSPPSTSRISWCIDSLRQSLMCTADINPMVYSRSPETGEFELSDTNAYTCRDFEAIREWASGRQLVAEIGLKFDETEYW